VSFDPVRTAHHWGKLRRGAHGHGMHSTDGAGEIDVCSIEEEFEKEADFEGLRKLVGVEEENGEL
jgi:hypothetical protein